LAVCVIVTKFKVTAFYHFHPVVAVSRVEVVV